MSNGNGAVGANGSAEGQSNGTVTLKRPRGGNGNGAGVVSMGNGTLLDLGGAGRIVGGALDGNGLATVDPVPPVPPVPVVPTKTRGPFNAGQLADLKLTEQVCLAALKPAYAPALATCQVTGEMVTALLNDVHAARTTATQAQTATNARMHSTREEKTARANLFLSFRAIQSAARQVFAHTRPDHLRDYGVGVVAASRDTVTQIYNSIQKQLQSDTLPGISNDKIALLTQRFNDWNTTMASQTDSQASATSHRSTRNADTSSLAARRRQIQNAANGLWSPSPQNHAIRREFAISPARNFSTTTRPSKKRKLG